MSTPFQSALLSFLAAERVYASTMERPNPQDVEHVERALAQAGDVLESELRRMMREEGIQVVDVGRIGLLVP